MQVSIQMVLVEMSTKLQHHQDVDRCNTNKSMKMMIKKPVFRSRTHLLIEIALEVTTMARYYIQDSRHWKSIHQAQLYLKCQMPSKTFGHRVMMQVHRDQDANLTWMGDLQEQKQRKTKSQCRSQRKKQKSSVVIWWLFEIKEEELLCNIIYMTKR